MNSRGLQQNKTKAVGIRSESSLGSINSTSKDKRCNRPVSQGGAPGFSETGGEVEEQVGGRDHTAHG